MLRMIQVVVTKLKGFQSFPRDKENRIKLELFSVLLNYYTFLNLTALVVLHFNKFRNNMF